MSASQHVNIKDFSIISPNGDKVEITAGVVAFFYYEDIFSPAITAKVTFLDTGKTVIDGKFTNLITGLPMRTGEKCSIKITNQLSQTLEFRENDLFVNKISSLNRENSVEVSNFHFISGAGFTNEFSRVHRRLPQIQSNLNVKSIVEQELESNRAFFSDSTSTQMAYQGNSRKPFTVIMNLATRSIAQNGNAPGFLFYETAKGFNYRSIENLCSQQPSFQYYYSNVTDSSQDVKTAPNDFKILNFNMSENNDVIYKLRLGSYSSRAYVFDPLRGTIVNKQITFNSEKLDSVIEKLGNESIIPEQTLNENPSRIFSGVLDIGNGALNRENRTDLNIDPSEYLAQSPIRYNVLFTQNINIVVPSNFQLHAGDVIECKIPDVNKDSFDPKLQGNYLIRELCHYIGNDGQALTYLKLARDSYS